MRKTEKAVLIEGLRKLSADALWIADALEGKETTKAEITIEVEQVEPGTTQPSAEPVSDSVEEAPVKEEKTYTFEEVRGLLADKARAGFRAEVKALLTSHNVEKLSEITDPDELRLVVKEAEAIGNG